MRRRKTTCLYQLGAGAVRRDQIQQGARDIGRVLAQHLGTDRACLTDRLGISGSGGERLRCLQATFAEDALRRLGDRDQDATDAAVLLSNRAIREDEVTLFGEAVPVEREQEVDDG